MNARKTKRLLSLAALTACLSVSAPALSEGEKRPLSMSYQILGIKSETAKPAPVPANRCGALTWLSSIGACGRDLLAKIAPSAERHPPALASEGEDSTAAADSGAATDRRVAVDAGLSRTDVVATIQLPALSPEDHAVRAAPAREALSGTSRSADLLLRVGSNHRVNPNDVTFTDANYQAHVQNNGHKALGVELLLPFQ